MKIERFRIQGFKSIEDVTVDDLSDINVFFGLNDVGKLNLFEALVFWFWLLSEARSPKGDMPLERINSRFNAPLFRLDGRNLIQINVDVVLDRQDLPKAPKEGSPAALLLSRLDYLDQSKVSILITDDSGQHFELIPLRMNTAELEAWLSSVDTA